MIDFYQFFQFIINTNALADCLCPLYAGASAHYARSLKTVVDDLQKVKATIFLGVPLLYDKMFKKIHKGIQEDKLKSKIVPPLISLNKYI